VGIPRRYLGEGEEVLDEVRPHWSFFTGPGAALASLLVLAVAIPLNAAGTARDVLLAPAVVGLLAALGWTAFRYARWATAGLVVTTERIIHRQGIRARHSRELALAEVVEVSVSRTAAQRLVGSGDLVITSRGGHEVVVPGLPGPAGVRQLVVDAASAAQEGGDEDDDGAGPRQPSAEPSPLDHLERLDELRRRGVISRAEFEAKKAQLLDRL